jgi:glycine cleavage system H protein
MAEEYVVRAFRYYTENHTWARIMDDGNVVVGITDYAQKQIREIVFIQLPEVGSEVKQMQLFGSIESIKAVSELHSPISGEVKEINERVINDPSLINRDPYDAGWLVVVTPLRLKEELKSLKDAEAYAELIKNQRN